MVIQSTTHLQTWVVMTLWNLTVNRATQMRTGWVRTTPINIVYPNLLWHTHTLKHTLTPSIQSNSHLYKISLWVIAWTSGEGGGELCGMGFAGGQIHLVRWIRHANRSTETHIMIRNNIVSRFLGKRQVDSLGGVSGGRCFRISQFPSTNSSAYGAGYVCSVG